MAMLKSIMIDTLRDSSENETVWKLRRSFLDKNWTEDADTTVKDHIITLSQCFVGMALQRCEYPDYVMQEVYERSCGLIDDISKALLEMQNQTSSTATTTSVAETGYTNMHTTSSLYLPDDIDNNALSVIPRRKPPQRKMAGPRKPRYTHPPSLTATFVKASTSQASRSDLTYATESQGSHFPVTAENLSTTTSFACSKINIDTTGYWTTPDNSFSKASVTTSHTNNRSSANNPMNRSTANCNQRSTTFTNSVTHKTTNKGSANSQPTSTKTSPQNMQAKKVAGKSNTSNDPQSGSKEDDLIFENMVKLGPILDMANWYTEMLENSEVDSFSALKKCSAEVALKMKCVSKARFNEEGSKVIGCQVFVDNICLSSVVVPAGTKPNEARKQLAEMALEKICLPYLRLVPDGNQTLQLEASKTPFVDEDSPGDVVDIVREVVKDNEGESVKIETNEAAEALGCDDKENQFFTHPYHYKIPLVPGSLREFDSYIEWVNETHPVFRKIRQLGHMYVTLPYSVPDPGIILQCLSNISGIEFDLHPRQMVNETQRSYDFIMDKEILVASCTADSEAAAFKLGSQAILEKISMHYLCLRSNTLQTSNVPFPGWSRLEHESERIVYDSWQTGDRADLPGLTEPPLRFGRFCVVQGPVRNYRMMLLKSAEMNQRKIELKGQKVSSGKGGRICSAIMQGREVGRFLGGGSNKKGRNGAAEVCINNLRPCHWLIQEEPAPKDDSKHVLLNDLALFLPKEYTQSSNPSVIDSSNKGYQLLSKMGWSCGGIGKKGTGIAEPISIKMFRKNSGLGYQSGLGPDNIEAVGTITTMASMDIKAVLQAYADSRSHRDLKFPARGVPPCQRVSAIADTMDMIAVRRGLENRRFVVNRVKKMTARTLFSELLNLGGKSDRFRLVPPQDVHSKNGRNDSCAANSWPSSLRKGNKVSALDKEGKLSKRVQCNLIEAPVLERLKPGPGVEIILDFDEGGDDSDEGEGNAWSGDEVHNEDDDEDDNDDVDESGMGPNRGYGGKRKGRNQKRARGGKRFKF